MHDKNLLLVEGNDDFHVVLAIQGQRSIRILDKKDIVSKGGIDELIESFPVHLKGSDIRALGAIVDADTDLNNRWLSLRNRLTEAGYENVPATPDIKGTVVAPPASSILPRVGIWLMPDNAATGILEDFLRYLVPENDVLFSHVEASVNSIPETERRFSALAKPKALIHTWLALQEEPGRPLGQSITAQFLNHDVPQVDLFVAWLQKLYD
jgi:hypothetical protein